MNQMRGRNKRLITKWPFAMHHDEAKANNKRRALMERILHTVEALKYVFMVHTINTE